MREDMSEKEAKAALAAHFETTPTDYMNRLEALEGAMQINNGRLDAYFAGGRPTDNEVLFHVVSALHDIFHLIEWLGASKSPTNAARANLKRLADALDALDVVVENQQE